MIAARIAPICCMLTFHAPDGSVFLVERNAVKAVKPIAAKHHDHLPQNVRSVLYLEMRGSGFGIAETVAEVMALMQHCGEPASPPAAKAGR